MAAFIEKKPESWVEHEKNQTSVVAYKPSQSMSSDRRKMQKQRKNKGIRNAWWGMRD